MTRLACVALAIIILRAESATQQRSEFEVKAAYLQTFGRFVEWPAARQEPEFIICVLGTDPFGPVLDATLTDTAVHGRKVVARRIATAADATRCHILFISGSEQERLTTIVSALGPGVLTVSDIPGFVGGGGMIQFHLEGNRIRFHVDLERAMDAGLMMSSELLRVASSVRRDGKAGV
jgi:hypothetical protein